MNHARLLRGTAAAAFVALTASCYYSPYDTVGYSSSVGFATGGTTFIHTSSNRWLYDPTVRCYFDNHRRCFYDPWIGGYYPVGYCPPPIRHVPHPYGWSGRGYCPPPTRIHNRCIDGYHDRVGLLRSRNLAWAASAQEDALRDRQAWAARRHREANQFVSMPTPPSMPPAMVPGAVATPPDSGNRQSLFRPPPLSPGFSRPTDGSPFGRGQRPGRFQPPSAAGFHQPPPSEMPPPLPATDPAPALQEPPSMAPQSIPSLPPSELMPAPQMPPPQMPPPEPPPAPSEPGPI